MAKFIQSGHTDLHIISLFTAVVSYSVNPSLTGKSKIRVEVALLYPAVKSVIALVQMCEGYNLKDNLLALPAKCKTKVVFTLWRKLL